MDDSVRLRPGTTDDLRAISDLLDHVFHNDADDEERANDDLVAEPARSLIADDDGAVVGHTTALTRDLTVPGAVIPAAHITGVGVAPTHRRRGLLTAMMTRQLTELAEAGREPVAVLWASETKIYPRFGYGPAAVRLRIEAMSREIRLAAPAAPAGRLRMIGPKDAIEELSAVYDRVRPGRIGWSSRPGQWWQHRLADLKDHRGGATATRGVICDGPDGPRGYAMWRVKDDWNEYGPDAQVRIREIVADDPATYATLWGFLFGIDLARGVSFDFGALDEPLQYLVDEPRRLGLRVSDGLWIRIVDLPAALEARRYPVPVDAVLEVTDPLLPANSGRWRLTGGPDKAACVRTDDPADVVLSITDLGAIYLGGTTPASLVAAGRVRQLTDRLVPGAFGWARQPNPIEVF